MPDDLTTAGEPKGMDWISWDHTLRIGHARMDADHEELAGLFNLLPRAVEQRKGRDYCVKVLDDIIQRATIHFDLERQLMMQHQYPKTEHHTAEHAMLIEQALQYKANFDLDSSGSRIALARFPEVWLAFHILFSDKELANFLALST
jgi:hemerythrin-like metal-binding protein